MVLRRPTTAQLEKRLGVPLGKTLAALVELAYSMSPEQPAFALEELDGLTLGWLARRGSVGKQARTPPEMLRIGEGNQLVEFGFWLRDARIATDKRPIMIRAPKEDDSAPWLAAPSLAEFLGLVAMVGLDLSRRRKDAAWTTLHRERMRDRDFARASAALCTVPGVRIPSRPSKIVLAFADVTLAPAPEPRPIESEHLPIPKDPMSAIEFAREALDDGRFGAAATAARNAMREPVYACDAQLVLASALLAQRKAAQARAELIRGAARWLERPREFYSEDQLEKLRDVCGRAAVPSRHALAKLAGVTINGRSRSAKPRATRRSVTL